MYNTTERELLDLYESIYKEDTETNDLIIQLCESCEYGTDLEDRSEFAQVIIEDDCIFEFLELVADDFGIDIAEILSEEVYLTENKNKALLDVLRAVGMMSGVLKTPAKQAASKAASKATQKVTSKAISGTPRQGRLLTNKGTAQNFTRGRTPFTATDPVPAASSPLPQVKRPAPSAPGQRELNLRTTPGAGRREVASSGGISSKGGSRMGPDGSKGTALPGRITTPKSTGGLLGTRNIPRPGAGLPRQAPKPAWGPGGTGGPGLPRAPRQPGGAMTKRPSASVTTPGVQKVKVKDMGPTGRSTVDKGARTLKGDGVIDVTAKTVSSRRTTSQFLKDLARAAKNNKGKVAAGAAIAGGTALGLATGDGKRTASRDTAPTTPSKSPTSKGKTEPASKGKTKTGLANIPPAEGLVNNPNYGKPGTSTSKDKSPTSGDKSPTSRDKSPTSSTKKDETKAKINKEYDRLRGKDPKTGIVKGSSESQAKASAYARRENERIYGKNYAKPKTPNPLMKGFRKEDYYYEISEYLISEGFASSESNASRIISVMSQAWVDQIVESSCGGGHSKKKKKKKGY